MPIEGVDYSDARPGGTRLKEAGKRFAVRYLYPGVGKGLTASEVRDLHDHGVELVTVFEGAPGGMRGGRAQGVSDARLAQVQLASLPLDHRLPIYFAKDYDGGLGTAEIAYLAGVASVIGHARVGLYGGWAAIGDAIAGRHAAWLWQTYAWSGGRVRDGIHLLQYSNGEWGGSVDFTRALTAEYGQHAPAAAAAAAPTAPAPAPTPEDDMPPCYFKGDRRPDVFVLSRLSGKKRHVPHSEWLAASAGMTLVTIPQADADAIPSS